MLAISFYCEDHLNIFLVNFWLLEWLMTIQAVSLLQGGPISADNLSTEISMLVNLVEPVAQSNNTYFNTPTTVCNTISSSQINPNVQQKDSIATGAGDPLDLLIDDGLNHLDSFGKWMNYTSTESSVSGDSMQESSVSSVQHSFTSPEHIFTITEVSHEWAYSTEKTKVFS